MRIIGGRLKGRRLDAPTWQGLRPTSDKLRETLFNVLQGRMAGARFLDVFAGTGAVGIEALSRGAAEITFIEKDPRAVALIEANLAACGIEADYNIRRGEVLAALRDAGATFDVILLDPPYDLHPVSPTLEAAAARLSADLTRREPRPWIGGRAPRMNRSVEFGSDGW